MNATTSRPDTPPAPYRILMLTCQFMPEVYGGAEQQCLKQAQALVARGHRVVVLTSRTKDSTPKEESMGGIDVVRHNTIHPPDLLGRWLPYSLLWLLQLAVFAWTHRGQFDIVHCHQGKFGLFAGAMIANILDVPQVVKIGNSSPYMDLEALRNKKLVGPLFLKWALAKRPTFVAISGMIAQNLRDFGVPEQDIAIIVNGVLPLESRYKTFELAKPHLFWHGRFESIKNLELMLEAFALAMKDNPGMTLHLVGSGTQETALRALAVRLGIDENIEFVGPPPSVLNVIGQYDIFINTSLAEGMSNAMLEAMALGKALLSTPVSGSAEIIDSGRNGYVVSDYTATAMAKGIKDTVAMCAKRGAEVFAHNTLKTREQFAVARIAARYEELYRQLLAKEKTT